MSRRYIFFAFLSASLLLLAAQQAAMATGTKETHPALAAPSASVIRGHKFIENKGQWADSVLYLTQRGGMDMWILPSAFVYDVYKLRHTAGQTDALDPAPVQNVEREGHVFRMNFLHASRAAAQGNDLQSTRYNYYIGNDPAHWASNVRLYSGVQLSALYPGIDAVVYDDNGSPRYDLVVQPGANANQIAIGIDGAANWWIDDSGDLQIKTSVGTVTQGKLFAYQEVNGKRQQVECTFAISGTGANRTLGFALGAYDTSLPLVIDPLIYSTYIGGTNSSNYDVAHGVQVDPGGYAYVTGYTDAVAFPPISGTYRVIPPATGGNYNVFVAKVWPDGTTLDYLSILGGNSADIARDIALDGANNAYITGYTASGNFPTFNAIDPTYNGGAWDVFVTKLNANGELNQPGTYSTYLGGDDVDKAFGIDVEGGSAYITGYSGSMNYPTLNAYDAVGDIAFTDVIVSKIDAAGALSYSTYMGLTLAGNQTTDDIGYDIVVRAGSAYITGMTRGLFPTTAGAYDPTYNMGGNLTIDADAFVAKLTNNTLDYSTFFGGTGFESATGIAVDNNGSIYIIGSTSSDEAGEAFPLTPNSFDGTFNGNNAFAANTDAFIAKFTAAGGLDYSTYLGGNDIDFGYRITVDSPDLVYAVGASLSPTMTTYPNPGTYFSDNQGGLDLFFVKLSTLGAGTTDLLYATYFGGNNYDGELPGNMGINLQSNIEAALPSTGLAHRIISNSVTVAGPTQTSHTGTPPFPLSPGAYDITFNGNVDAFVTQFQMDIDRIIVTSPITAQERCAGEFVDVNWTATTGIKRVLIDLSNSSGTFVVGAPPIADITLGTPPFTWRWNIPANQTPGTYRIQVRDFSNGTIVSTTAVITVKAPPIITVQPQTVATCLGSPVSIPGATATGTDLTYTWYRVGNPTPLSSTSLPAQPLSLGNATLAMNGTQYYVVVSNGVCASATSITVTVIVNDPPTVTGPNVSMVTLCEGSSTTLTISTTGTAVKVFWEYQKLGFSTWAPAGSTTNTLTLGPPVDRNMQGKYRARVENPCGTVYSSIVTLEVHWGPTIDQPDFVVNPVCEGDPIEIRGLLSNANPAAQTAWKVFDPKNGDADVTASVLPPGTIDDEDLTIPNAQAAWDGYKFYATVWNDCGIVTTNTLTLQVRAKPSITPSTDNYFELCEGQHFEKQVIATGASLAYQWFKVGSGAVPGATTNKLVFDPVAPSDAGEYYVVVQNTLCPSQARATSAIVTLVVKTKPVVDNSPTAQTVCEGGNTSFSVDVDPATKPDPIIYWEVSTDNGATWSTVATLIFPNTDLQLTGVTAGMDGNLYRAKLVNECDSVLSNTALLTVNTKPLVDNSPTAQTVCEGDNTSFSVDVDPTTKPNPIIYWEVSTDNGATWSTVATLVFPNTDLQLTGVTAGMNGNIYRAKLVNECDSALSNTALLTVNTKPVVDNSPTAQTVCEGDNTSFSVTVQPTTKPDPIIYWEVSTDNGATWSTVATLIFPNTDLQLTGVTAGMDGNLYRAKLVNECDSVLSNTALLTVNTKPLVDNSPTAQTVCEGDNTSFSVDVDPTTKPNPIIYWEVSTDNGATWSTVATLVFPNTDLQLTGVTAGMNGNIYRAKLVNECDSALSNTALLTVNTKPVVDNSPTAQTVCEGDNTSFSVTVQPTTKPDPIIYWEVSTDNGATWSTVATLIFPNTDLQLTGVTAGMDGNLYRAKLVNECDSALSNTALLTVNTKPVVDNSPTAQTVCEGDNTSFSVGVDPTTKPDPIIYWEVSTDNGATWSTVATLVFPNTDLQLTAVNVGMNGNLYRAKLVNECDSVLSNTALLTVNTKPVVDNSPTAQTVCEGDNTSFSVGVDPTTKPDPIIYWEVSTDNGATWSTVATLIFPNTDLQLTGVTADMNGNLYRAKLVNECDSALSNTALLTVNTKPVVDNSPTAQTVCEGDNTSFSVDVDPTTKPNPIIYWEVSTDNGATWSTVATLIFPSTDLQLTGVTAGMDGNLYRAKLVNECDSALSNTALLTVNTKPVVDNSPTAQTVCEGDDTSFSVDVKPTTKPDPIIYWEVSTDNGATWSTVATLVFPNTNLQLTSVTADMDGNLYRAKLVNECDSALSNPALLTVRTAPVAGLRPDNKTVCEGETAFFTVTMSGIPTPDIQWQQSTNGVSWNNVSDGGQYSGATTLVLTVSNITFAQNGYQFRAVFSNPCGTAISTSAILTVHTKPIVNAPQPSDQTVCEGTMTTFNASATGIPTPAIRWEVSSDGSTYTVLANGGQYSGTTSSTLTVSNILYSQNGYRFRAVFSNECGESTSASAMLTVKLLPRITGGPTSATICVGESFTFTVQSTGSDLQYQWQRDGSNIAGANGITYTIPAVAESDAGVYTVVVSGYCPPTVITSATLNVNAPPRITLQPISVTVCEGNDVNFTVEATGASISYQWYKDGQSITGATQRILSLSSVSTAQAGTYYVEVHGICPITPATSAVVELTVNTSPRITNQPLSRSACEGETVVFNVGVTGTDPQFQWRRNGTNLPGATNSQLVLNSVTAADAGNYDVIITGTCQPPVTSTIATLVVNTAPLITQDPKDTIICEGETLVLTVDATGAGRTFQWRKNGANIPAPEGTSQNYTVPSVTDIVNGTYDVIVSGTCAPPDTSLPAIVRVQRPPQLTNSADFPIVHCAGEVSRDTLTLFNPGAAPVSMNGVTVNNPRFVVVDPIGPFSIPAGGSRNIVVEFRPVKAGTEIASVNLTTVRCNSQILAQITAHADSIRIASLPEVQFKSTAQCDGPDVQEVLIENTGDVEVRITPIFSDPQFALDNPGDNPIVIAARSSKRVRVRFTSNGTPNTSIVANVRFITEQCSFETITVLRAGSIRVAYQATVPGGVLDFGTLAGCKTSSSLTFTVRNTGNAVVSITSATTTNPAFGVILPQTPLVLAVGSSATITVQFGAGPPGLVTGKLVLRSGAPCPKDTVFDLVGNRGDVAIAPDIQTIAYGKLLSCAKTTGDTVLVITNNGTEDASFAAPDIQPPFAIEDVQPGPGFPRIIKAGESIRVRISFKPGADGNYSYTARFPYKWGECSDALQIPLSGALSTPKLRADLTNIDFKPLLGCEGTVDTVITLINEGGEDMTINDIIDPAGYRVKELLSSSLPLVIPANGGSVKIRIRFAPPAPGTYDNALVLTAQPCNVKVTINLHGAKQGVSFADIPSDVIDFGTTVNCGNTSIPPKSFTITNTSDGDVEGRVTYTITGPFTTTLQQNAVLTKGSPVPFDISFDPTGNGTATGELKLFYEPCGITRTITLRGTITNVALVNSGIMVFGDQTVNSTSGQKVATFTNSGSTTLTISSIDAPAAPFTVVSVTPPIPAVLKPGESLTVILTFTPTDDITYNDVLRVHSDNPCAISDQIAIEGRGTNAPQPNITFKGLDFGQVYVSMKRSMKVSITNDGQDEGQIFNILSDDPQFTVETLTYPIKIAKDQTIDVEITFEPASPGIKTAKLKVLSDGGSPEDILRGEGIPLPVGQTVLALPTVTAEAGTEDFPIPIRLTNQQQLAATESIESLTFKVTFNSTLFYPTHTSKGTIKANDFDEATHTRTVTIELTAADFAGIPAAGDVLTELYGNVLLGNSETTDLTFSDIEWKVGLGTATATSEHGSLTLTNVCRVGGARLIKLNKSFGITTMTPNPASEAVEVVVEVPVAGPATLQIYSITGKLMYEHQWTVSRSDGSTATPTGTVFILPTTELPSGSYQVILRSTERIDSQRLIIVK